MQQLLTYWTSWLLAESSSMFNKTKCLTKPFLLFWIGLLYFSSNIVVGQKMYWTDFLGGKIQRANIDGSNVEDLITTGLSNPVEIVISGTKMYWVDQVAAKIQRANLDGTNIEDLTVGLTTPAGIAISGTKMYWTSISGSKIQRANLDGTNVEDLVTGLGNPVGITTSGTKMYWVDINTKKVQRANLDGTNVEDLVTGLGNPFGIAISGTKMYWTDLVLEKIQRANLDGSGIEDLVTTGLSSPFGITVFGTKMYWADANTDDIKCANLDGTNVAVLVSGLNYPWGIVIDGVPVVPTMTATATSTDVTCSGSSDGSVAISVTGGTAPYTVNGVQYMTSPFTITGLAAGSYSFTVTDNASNTAVAGATVGASSDNIAPTVVTQNITVPLGANGSATITAAQIDNGSSDNCSIASRTLNMSSFTCANVGPNAVVLTVIDANGNTATGTATVTVEDNIAPTVTTQNITVPLGANGSATITAAQIDNGSSDNCSIASRTLNLSSFTCANVGPNAVVLTVTDINGKTNSATATVTITTDIAATASMTTCSNNMNGVITVTASGGTAPFEYSKDNGISYQSSNVFTSLAVGNYNIVVKDAGGCMTSAQTVSVSSCFSALASNTAMASCSGGNDGAVEITMTGGTMPYTVNGIQYNTNPFTIIGLAAGNYNFTVTENGGNSTVASVTVAATSDNTPPTAVAQNMTVQLDAVGNATITASQVDNGSTDDCDNNPALSLNQTSFDCSNVGPNTVVLTVTDANGNTNSATAIVTVTTNLTALASITICSNNANGGMTITANGGTAPFEYSKDNGVSYQSSNVFTGLAVGNYEVVVRDANGCMTAAQTVSIMSCFSALASNITNVPCAGGNDGAVEITMTGGTMPYTVNGIQYNANPFTITGLATGNYTFTVTENGGNSAVATATVGTLDNTAPTVVTQNATIQLDANGNANISAPQIDNGSGDNCGNISTSLSMTNFTCANLGNNTVTLTVTDGSSNVATGAATVTVEDNIAPTVITQDLTVELNDTGSINITAAQIDNGSSDNCSIVTRSLDVTSFTCMNLGANTVTLTVADASGNTTTGTATVTIADNTAPTVVTQDLTIPLAPDGNAGITTADIDNGSVDNCGIASMSLDSTNFTCAHIGPNTVTLTVTDVNGNTATGTAIVTIEENFVPMVVTQSITVPLDSNGMAVITASDIDNGSVDNCGVASTSLDVTSFTCADIGTNTVTLTVTDVSGNIATGVSTVTVEDNIAPTVVTQDLTLQLDANNAVIITTADIDNGSSDNCGIQSMSLDVTDFDCSDVGTTTVTLTVTDVNGNVSTDTALVTIEDNVFPVVLGRDIVVELDVNGTATITAADVDDGSSDNCGIQDAVIDVANFSCANLGANPVTLTITDANGNTASTDVTVTVQDNRAPMLVCQPYEWQLDEIGVLTLAAEDLIDNIAENCNYTASISQTTFNETHVGENLVTVTATDDAGNTTSCQTIVTVSGLSCLSTNVVITPNGDGKNDTWEIVCIASLPNTVSIYNRFSQLVYQTTNYTGGWNGLDMDNEELPQAAYYYIITAVLNGEPQLFKGNISILKK